MTTVTTDNTIDPRESADRTFNWAPRLALLAPGEIIASHTVTIVDKLGSPATNATVAATTHTDTSVSVRLSAATGTDVYALCLVTTSTGELLADTWHLIVELH